jgi:hypothetical protein
MPPRSETAPRQANRVGAAWQGALGAGGATLAAGGEAWTVFLIGFPLLIIPLAIYNMIVFATPGVQWTDKVATIDMLSGAQTPVTISDLLIMLSLFLLLVEILKAGQPEGRSGVDQFLAFVVFVGALAELLLVGQAGNATFAIITAICLVDFLGGLSHRRRPVPPVAPEARPKVESDAASPTTAS